MAGPPNEGASCQYLRMAVVEHVPLAESKGRRDAEHDRTEEVIPLGLTHLLPVASATMLRSSPVTTKKAHDIVVIASNAGNEQGQVPAIAARQEWTDA